MEKLVFSELTYQIRGALIAVHCVLGPGFREETYHRALLLELKTREIAFETEKEIRISYQDQLIDQYRLDLVIEEKVVIELKAVDEIHPRHIAQLISYLKAGKFPIGLLVNFGAPSLQVIRRVNQKSAPSALYPRNPRTSLTP